MNLVTTQCSCVNQKVKISTDKGPFKCYVTQWGVGGCQLSQKKSVMKVYGPMLLALRGGGWGSNSLEKSVTPDSMQTLY